MLTKTTSRILFGSALVLFCVGGTGATIAVFHLLNAEGWVMHTRDVQVSLERINTLFSRAGRARTEYINSRDPARLTDFQAAAAQIPESLSTVKGLTVDNPAQQETFQQLASLSAQRLQLLNTSVAENGTGISPAQAGYTQQIVVLGTRMDALIQTMQNEEQRLLDLRVGRKESLERLAAVLLVLAFLIAGALFILDYRLLNKELRARESAQSSLQLLSARLLRLQDEERRKFSRELHDSMGQILVSIKMQLDLLALSLADNSTILNCSQLLDEALRETRTISHLLHPPLLDQAGLESAAREYVDGFSKRSGIPVTFEAQGKVERLSPVVELTLFRVLQESLTNIHKHAAGSQASVVISFDPTDVTLSIRDNGKGIPERILDSFENDGAQLGVGLAGMRERVRELGGQIKIHSDSRGTVITTTLARGRYVPQPVAELEDLQLSAKS